ncbi:hypothetical protein EHF_0927 [Ehrlichia japonica]|uniref:Uncharacterized protein n=1 Tax=Ehrlichia japonica TaxID=391036 RepID=X5GCD4_9RICK|nr:hypothetical protein EHF_0927 [Ehrlichia japonica]
MVVSDVEASYVKFIKQYGIYILVVSIEPYKLSCVKLFYLLVIVSML